MANANSRPRVTATILILALAVIVTVALVGTVLLGHWSPGQVTQLDINSAPPHAQSSNG